MEELITKENYVTINGLKHFILEYDHHKAITVIHIHGGPLQSEVQLSYPLEEINDFCNLIYYDQRGTGRTLYKSETKPKDISLDILIEDLRDLVGYVKEEYPNTKIVLLAHSYGTVIGTQFIIKYPKVVDAYVGYGQIINFLEGEAYGYKKMIELAETAQEESVIKKLSSIGDYPYKIPEKKLLKAGTKVQKLKRKLGFYNVKLIFTLATRSPLFKISDLTLLMKSAKYSTNLVKELVSYDLSNIKSYDVPIFFIQGIADLVTPNQIVSDYYRKVLAPKKDMFIVDNAGHSPDIENSKRFMEILKEISEKIQ